MPRWLASETAESPAAAPPPPDPEIAPAAAPDGPPGPFPARRLPWRAELPRWPDEWRERWGRRSADLEDAGVPWPESERVAFEDVSRAKAAAERAA